jgi:hypothetical protein
MLVLTFGDSDVMFDSMIDPRDRLGYRHVEATLAGLMSVDRKSMGAFRAKLRHLRNIGVPQLPSPGSGRPIEYSRLHALELMIALELEKLGHSPRSVALNAPSIVAQAFSGQPEEDDCRVMIHESVPGYTIAWTEAAFFKYVMKAPNVFTVINVSGCVRRLDDALDRVVG